MIATASHESEEYSWLVARGRPHPGLADVVISYQGYVERSVKPLRRRETPDARVPVIISFGDAIDVGPHRLTSFVATLSSQAAVTRFVGRQCGIQVDLTPLGAFRLFGLGGPTTEVAVELPALFGRRAVRLVERLAAAPDWAARFTLLDQAILELLAVGVQPAGEVAWAWRQLDASWGRAPVGRLAAEVGWSRRHFGAVFERQVGLPPKVAARVIRFGHAVRMLDARRTFADVAAECGYSDQSHLVHEFRDLAGCTPSVLLAEQLSDMFDPGCGSHSSKTADALPV